MFALGVGYEHVSPAAASVVLYTLIVTAVLSTYTISNNHRLAGALTRWLERLGMGRWFAAGPPPAQEDESRHRGPRRGDEIFLLGVSGESLALVDYLRRHAPRMMRRLVAIDVDVDTLERLRSDGIEAHYGDIANAETLRHVGIDEAAAVVFGESDMLLRGTTSVHLLQQVRGLAVNARVMATAADAASADTLYAAGADYVVVPSSLAGEHLHQTLGDGSAGALAKARRLQAIKLFGR